MAKKDKTKKSKGKEPELSKKDRKKLEQRAAKLEAELAERVAAEAKAAKKAAKKGVSDVDATRRGLERRGVDMKKMTDKQVLSKAAKVKAQEELSVVIQINEAVIPDELDIATSDETMLGKLAKPEKVIAAADKVLADKNASKGAKEKARKAKERVEADKRGAEETGGDPDVARIKERVEAKAAARARLEELDRDDEDAVRAFNETDGKLLSHYATYTGEVEETLAKMDRTEQRKKASAAAEPEVAPVEEKPAEPTEPVKHDVEEVETETGRVFEAGAAETDVTPDAALEEAPEVSASEKATQLINDRGFALPSEARGDFETNGNGQYKVKRPIDGKIVGYTRVTTFIDAIDDKKTLTDWKLRTLLEGIVVNEEQVGTGKADDLLLSKVRDLVHTRDVAITKARKAERKGKLVKGEATRVEASARKVFKDGVNTVVNDLLEMGGVHEKANRGTDIHDLCQLYDQSGMDAVAQLLTNGKISEADFADVEAYARALVAAGIKHIDSEVMVVNDEAKRAGRLDSIKMVRFPGAARAVRVVADIKTGSVEFGTKIPMQLENYASMQGYDPSRPDEREDLKLSRTKALLIHLPQGTGECHLYPVDLATGRIGNKIAKDVRDFRTAGKRGIDFKTDLATGIAFAGDPEAVS